jgi:hypothetical protein
VSASISLGDVVMIEARHLGALQRVYRDIAATDRWAVTRVDRAAGRKAVYLRKVSDRTKVVMAWPEQVRVVSRQARPAARRRA